MTNPRPHRNYKTGAYTRALRLLGVAATFAITVAAIFRYPSLPQVIPIHFDATGKADGWGARTDLWWLMAIMTLLVLATAWLSTKPQLFNYPTKVTADRAQDIYREGERMMVWALTGLVILYGGAVLLIFGKANGALVGVGIVAMLSAMIVGIVRMSALKEPRP